MNMNRNRSMGMMVIAGWSLLAAIPIDATAQGIPLPLCSLMIHEEQLELEETELALALARTNFAAFEKIFKLIDKLWNSEVIERMVYLESRYDRDAARLTLDRAGLILERQMVLIEQYRQACETGEPEENQAIGSGSAPSFPAEYRKAHCDSLSKAAEAAAVNLEFNRVLLANVLDLRAGQVATQVQVILAELEVELEEKRLEDALRRTESCRRALGAPPEAD